MTQRQLCHKNLTSVWLMVQEGLSTVVHCAIYRQVNRLESMSLGFGGIGAYPRKLGYMGAHSRLFSLSYASQEVLNLIYGRREMPNEYGQFKELLETCELLIF